MKQKTGRLAGKIAVITGVSRARGIGSAIARAFALEGADIFFTHWTSYDRLQLRRGQGVAGKIGRGITGNLAYVATKGAISAFTVSLAAELAPLKITVNAVDPGPTDSGWMDEQLQQYLLPKFPMGRIGKPEDAARTILFLASDDAMWVTGQIIHSDGGYWD